MDETLELKRKTCHVTRMQGFWGGKKNCVMLGIVVPNTKSATP